MKDIQGKIIENAANEFSCIWKEHARLRGTKPRTTISDELSQTLNNLQAELESSDLYNDVPSRNGVMRRAIPKTLIDLLGLETLLTRLPEAYQRALFSSWVASHFVSFIYFLFCQWTVAYFFHLDLQIRCQWLECRFLPLCKRSCWHLLDFVDTESASVNFFHFAKYLAGTS